MAQWISKSLLSYALLLLNVTVRITAQHPGRPRAPGVVFGLTPDYGIAAIFLSDGTSVPIARVQGSPQYQNFMRENSTSGKPKGSTCCRWLSSILDVLPPALSFDVDMCQDAHVINTKHLLAALKLSVESYLSTNICFAALSFDDIDDNKAIVAQEALQAIGLRQVFPVVPLAKSAVRAHEPINLPEVDEEPWIVLAVDYSANWYNVGLYTIDEIGSVYPIEGTMRNPTIGEHNRLNAIRDTIGHLFADPTPSVDLLKQIHHLVVYGDDKKDDVLNLLTTIIDAKLIQDARVSSSIFEGVINTAHSMHVVMDTVDFETRAKSALGCRFRSELYHENRIEL